MGLRSWLLERTRRTAGGRAQPTPPPREDAIRKQPDESAATYASDWEPLPAYLPVKPQDHPVACVIASAIAAGDRPESTFTVRRVELANPEYRRVAVIATALAAGALASSSFTVKAIYKKKDEEGSHAA